MLKYYGNRTYVRTYVHVHHKSLHVFLRMRLFFNFKIKTFIHFCIYFPSETSSISDVGTPKPNRIEGWFRCPSKAAGNPQSPGVTLQTFGSKRPVGCLLKAGQGLLMCLIAKWEVWRASLSFFQIFFFNFNHVKKGDDCNNTSFDLMEVLFTHLQNWIFLPHLSICKITGR